MKIRKVACRFNDSLPVRWKYKKKGERKKWKVRKVTVLINSWTWSARSCRKVQCGCRIARIADNFASRNFLTCAFQATAQYILPDTYLPDLLYILLWRRIKDDDVEASIHFTRTYFTLPVLLPAGSDRYPGSLFVATLNDFDHMVSTPSWPQGVHPFTSPKVHWSQRPLYCY